MCPGHADRPWASTGGRQRSSGVRGLDQVPVAGAGQGLGAAAHPQLAIEIVDVPFYGAEGHDQLRGDLAVGESCRQPPPCI